MSVGSVCSQCYCLIIQWLPSQYLWSISENSRKEELSVWTWVWCKGRGVDRVLLEWEMHLQINKKQPLKNAWQPRLLILPRGTFEGALRSGVRSDLPRHEGVLGRGSTEGKEAKTGQNSMPSPYSHEVLWVWNLEENSGLILWAFRTPEKSWGICAEVAVYGFCWFLIPLASWGLTQEVGPGARLTSASSAPTASSRAGLLSP